MSQQTETKAQGLIGKRKPAKGKARKAFGTAKIGDKRRVILPYQAVLSAGLSQGQELQVSVSQGVITLTATGTLPSALEARFTARQGRTAPGLTLQQFEAGLRSAEPDAALQEPEAISPTLRKAESGSLGIR